MAPGRLEERCFGRSGQEPSLGIQVLGFIDDDPSMKAMRIMDVPVLGGCRDISKVVERYRNRTVKIEEVIVANASASGKQMREAHANCRGAGVLCRTIPSIGDILSGQYLSSQLRNISLEDLLGGNRSGSTKTASSEALRVNQY